MNVHCGEDHGMRTNMVNVGALIRAGMRRQIRTHTAAGALWMGRDGIVTR